LTTTSELVDIIIYQREEIMKRDGIIKQLQIQLENINNEKPSKK